MRLVAPVCGGLSLCAGGLGAKIQLSLQDRAATATMALSQRMTILVGAVAAVSFFWLVALGGLGAMHSECASGFSSSGLQYANTLR
jgi:hypothetical protein